MTDEQITALASEYAEGMAKGPEFEKLSDGLKENVLELNTDYVAEIFRWLCERFCLVEKSKIQKLDIAYRAKEYDMVVLNKGNVDYLFPDLGKEVEE